MHKLGAPLATDAMNSGKGKGSNVGDYKPKFYKGKIAMCQFLVKDNVSVLVCTLVKVFSLFKRL